MLPILVGTEAKQVDAFPWKVSLTAIVAPALLTDHVAEVPPPEQTVA